MYSIFENPDIIYSELEKLVTDYKSSNTTYDEFLSNFKFLRKEASNMLSDSLNNPKNYPNDLREQLETRLSDIKGIILNRE